jgi:hypothetical protein
MKIQNKNNLIILSLIVLVYTILTILSANHGYFWDTIQQISKEAHWFYQTNFSSLFMPVQGSGSGIVATGYHPPLMGIMTAALWKVFGYRLWVSHIFSLVWALILLFNVWKIVSNLFSERNAGWMLPIVLLEPTLLAQFSIASPDFILFTAFIISLRAVLENKPWLLSIGIFFLCGINMRGIFAGAALFLVNGYFNYLQEPKSLNIRGALKIILPYLPTVILLSAYFIYYFSANGWFFPNSTESGHYSLPTEPARVFKHLAEFGLRSIENGRIIVWLIGIPVAVHLLRTKKTLSNEYKAILLLFLLLTGLYLVFVFITQMPFSGRYFMPQFFLLTLWVLLGIRKFLCHKKVVIIFIVILGFELTGHCWIYPDKIAKSWDCTLAHLPYYELRNKCFQYIDQQKFDYKKVSGGFCLYGNRRFVELCNTDKTVETKPDNQYFIYSNISNLEDSFAEELKNKEHWIPIKKFEKGFVVMTIYKNLKYSEN